MSDLLKLVQRASESNLLLAEESLSRVPVGDAGVVDPVGTASGAAARALTAAARVAHVLGDGLELDLGRGQLLEDLVGGRPLALRPELAHERARVAAREPGRCRTSRGRTASAAPRTPRRGRTRCSRSRRRRRRGSRSGSARSSARRRGSRRSAAAAARGRAPGGARARRAPWRSSGGRGRGARSRSRRRTRRARARPAAGSATRRPGRGAPSASPSPR